MLLPFLIPGSHDEWRSWFADDAPRLLGVIIGIILIKVLSRPIIGHLLRGAAKGTVRFRAEEAEVVERRVRTVEGTISWAVTLVFGVIGIVIALDTLGLNVAPLIAGVGVVGIALGLGAQTLIKDVINGIFILVENQYSVGDVVRVGDVTGKVIEITPRRTVLRDQNGHVHVVPNSAISVATNMTQGFARINLTLTVSYNEDLDQVIPVIDEVCEQLARDFPNDVLEAPKVLRVAGLTENGVEVKIGGDVRVFTQWDLTGELRRRLKARFDRDGIDMPHNRAAQMAPVPPAKPDTPAPESPSPAG